MREPIEKSLKAFKAFIRFPKSAATAVLDRDFAERCKLPELSPELIGRIYSWPVKLPPLAHLRNGTQDLHGLVSLLAIAQAINAQRVFEIGTFTGLTTLALALNLPDATIHTLDLPPHTKGSLQMGQHDHQYLPDASLQRVYKDTHQEAARIVQHEGDSANFAFGDFGEQFDLVYVDGAHSYEYVQNDTEAAFQIVSANGAIVWDDYSRAWPDVAAYLDAKFRPATYCIPGIPRRLAVWFGDLQRIRNAETT